MGRGRKRKDGGWEAQGRLLSAKKKMDPRLQVPGHAVVSLTLTPPPPDGSLAAPMAKATREVNLRDYRITETWVWSALNGDLLLEVAGPESQSGPACESISRAVCRGRVAARETDQAGGNLRKRPPCARNGDVTNVFAAATGCGTDDAQMGMLHMSPSGASGTL